MDFAELRCAYRAERYRFLRAAKRDALHPLYVKDELTRMRLRLRKTLQRLKCKAVEEELMRLKCKAVAEELMRED